MSERATEVVEIKVHDIWRWMATLRTLAAVEFDCGHYLRHSELMSVVEEWVVLLGDEEE